MSSDLLEIGAKGRKRSLVEYKRLAVTLSVSLAVLLASAVGIAFYQSNFDAFLTNKGEEKTTALELMSAFVNDYAHVRRSFVDGDPPIPASFRANALARFNAGRNADEQLMIQWVGVPGREIRTAPGDAELQTIVSDLASQATPEAVSNIIERGDEVWMRSVFPSVAVEQSCVSCHNATRPVDPPWKIGDVMGAFAVDTPATAFLDDVRTKAAWLSTGVFVFVTTSLFGGYTILSRHRKAEIEIEARTHDRLSEAVREMAHGFAVFSPDGTMMLRNPAYQSVIHDDSTLGSREIDTSDGRVLRVDRKSTPSGRIAEVQTDLTDLKSRERELRTTYDRLFQANSAKSDFLARMSHELRTPMNAILGFSEVIRDVRLGGDVPSKYRRYAGDIHDSGSHLLSLINDVLDLSKIEAGKLELNKSDVDLQELVDSVSSLFRGQVSDAQIDLRVSIADAPATLIADSRALRQILINLISNAIRFTPPGGSVVVAAQDDGHGGSVLTVTDTGIGMTPEQVERALLPFEQAHDPTHSFLGGTGLGLPLSKNLIELHGGRLVIQSDPGAGTTVRVTVPSYPSQTLR